MSNYWLKDMRVVLSIVVGGFSLAALVTLVNETTSVKRQSLPDTNLNQEPLLSAKTTSNGRAIGIRVAQIHSLKSMESSKQVDDRDKLFLFKSPQSVQFSFGPYHFNSFIKTKPQQLKM